GRALLAVLDLDHLFGGNQDAAELLAHAGTGDALGDVALDRLLHARIGMDDVPAQVRVDGRRRYVGGGFDGVGHVVTSIPGSGHRKPTRGSCRSATEKSP